jgi:hypothetical protein
VLVVLLVAAAAILVGVIIVAIGRGGEMTEFAADVRPIDTHIETAADVALLRPPVALWGYDRRSTDEALNAAARTVTERDIEIATLRRQIADMQSAPGTGQGAQPGATGGPGAFGGQRGFGGSRTFGGPGAAGGPGASGGPGQAGEPGEAGEPGTGPAAAAGSAPPMSPFLRRQAGPAPPPGETQPWSAWERPEPVPGHGEPAEPGEAG